jgi:hypothetical protein
LKNAFDAAEELACYGAGVEYTALVDVIPKF